MRKFVLLAALLLASAAQAQTVQQTGTVTAGHAVRWVGNGIVGDAGTAANGFFTSLGVTNNGGPGVCVNSAATTALGYNQLCLSASTAAAAQITLQNYGTASPQNLQFVINGTTVTLPTGGTGTIPTVALPTVANNPICASNTVGSLADCGNGSNGQIWLGQTGAVPAWMTLSGDVSSIAAGGAVTLGKVNGVAFPAAPSTGTVPYVSGSNTVTYGSAPVTGGGTGAASLTNHGVLLGQGTNAIVGLGTSNVGYCLLSQGAGSDPIFAPCASGSGTAGGSNTQIQFNNSTSLAGSPNLTWVSPVLTIGANANATGQLLLANGGGSGQSVTLQNNGAVGAWNFNLPTGAGTLGQPLLSGGGGATAMTWGTLGIAAGGTNCTVASGTCLDNIAGFASNGFIQRTGAGTYTFVSSPIGVASGGTGLVSGTSGGVPTFTGVGTLASSGALTASGIVLGGGPGAVITSTAAGNNGQLLLGQTGGAPTWNSISGDISSISAAGVSVINKVNGVAYSTSPGTNTVPVVTSSNTVTYEALPLAALATIANGTVLGNSSGISAVPSAISTLPAAVQGNITAVGTVASGTWNGNAVDVAHGGTGQVTAQAARGSGSAGTVQGLNTDEMTVTSANASYAIQASDRVIATSSTAMTGGHTWTLPACNAVNAGQMSTIVDKEGVVGTFTLTIAAAGSDLVNGAASQGITTQHGGFILWCDGGNPGHWTTLATGVGGGGSVTAITAGNGLSGGTISTSGTIASYFDPGSITNCTLTGTVSGNALTVALLTQDGSTPSASKPCVVSFRSATAATGDYTAVPVTAATTFATGTSGSTFGASNSVAFRLWITAINNAGTVVLGVSNQSTATQIFSLNEAAVQSSTACNACTNATSAGLFYSTAAQTSKAIRILGYMDWSNGLATAGTFASGPTGIQLMGPGIKTPGAVLQSVYASFAGGSGSSSASATFVVSNVTGAITPTSAVNLIDIAWTSSLFNDTAGGQCLLQMSRGSSNNAGLIDVVTSGVFAAGTTMLISTSSELLDKPNTAASQTYTLQGKASSGTCFWNTGTTGGKIFLREIQG